MRLLEYGHDGELSLTKDLARSAIPAYAILSHTWGPDTEEVTFKDLKDGTGKDKTGYRKIWFCAEQARRDGLRYIWVDTCCIDKSSSNELQAAINSMFRWYQDATRCYVYLSDVTTAGCEQHGEHLRPWESAFRISRWFTRGWTLQELLAPASVEFFAVEGVRLGDKTSLEQQIHEISGIPIPALRRTPLSEFRVDERLAWAEKRKTTHDEDGAYCLLGIFDVFISLIYGEGRENAVRRLRRAIDEAVNPQDMPGQRGVHFMVPRSVNRLFRGRTQAVMRICRAIKPENGVTHQKRYVITGIGGQGKSELCLNVADQARDVFWGIFWIDVSSASTAADSFSKVAQLLGSAGTAIDDARHSLSNTTAQQNWLLILDNADDPDTDYHQYFPSGTRGAVLMTSRNPRYSIYSTVGFEELASLGEEDCIDLLLEAAGIDKAAQQESRAAARSITRMLSYHTLALVHAGAYIADDYCSVVDYPAEYQRVRERLLKFSPTQEGSRYSSVYATFEVSAQALESSASEAACDALRLLEVFSTLHCEGIPVDLFQDAWDGARCAAKNVEQDMAVDVLTRWHVSYLPQLFEADKKTRDSFRLLAAIGRLESLALVKKTKVKGSHILSMHPLTHYWVVERQKNAMMMQRLVTSTCIMALSRYKHIWWRPCRAYLGLHLQSLLRMARQTFREVALPREVLQTIFQIGWLLDDLRHDQDLASLLSWLFQVYNANPEEPSEELLPLYSLASLNRYQLGDIKTTTVVQERVLRMQETKLHGVHPARMISQDILAALYLANGQTNNAVQFLKQIVSNREMKLAKEHSERLTSQHVLAIAYEANGQVKEAITLLEHVVEVRKRTLAEEHPDGLASQHVLAIAYKANGQVKEAITLLEHVVEVRKRTLAEEHPDRLTSQHELATAYEANGQVKEAITLLEHVVEVEGRTLAEEHPDRLTSQHALATAYTANGQVKKAITLLEHVVEVRKRTLAEEHPDRLASEGWLAFILRN